VGEMILKIILLVIATEAVVELVKRAAPLQGIKKWIIIQTPFLFSEDQQTHLLDCPWCISLYAGALAMAAFFYMEVAWVLFITGSLAIARLSNFIHIIFSLMRDRQLNLRIDRR
jgi:hypothetical protein